MVIHLDRFVCPISKRVCELWEQEFEKLRSEEILHISMVTYFLQLKKGMSLYLSKDALIWFINSRKKMKKSVIWLENTLKSINIFFLGKILTHILVFVYIKNVTQLILTH